MSCASLSVKTPTECGGRCTACASSSALKCSQLFSMGRKASTISSWLRFMMEKKAESFSIEKPLSRANLTLFT